MLDSIPVVLNGETLCLLQREGEGLRDRQHIDSSISAEDDILCGKCGEMRNVESTIVSLPFIDCYNGEE
ncbi:hypothetical protein E2C01_083770 [Portunus trituberculatus]|uniref:Uncharacterized protein n=1 Tax=Portunus trituberculatus TaxID=210409 RepID=A0A5B7J7E9_PORTR|nr:hypothetical protein [Portunus trituberculatus]